MEPGDEVANHLDPGSLVKSPLGQGGPSLALLDGSSAAADMEAGKSEDQQRRLLEGNQVGSLPPWATCWLAYLAALGRAVSVCTPCCMVLLMGTGRNKGQRSSFLERGRWAWVAALKFEKTICNVAGAERRGGVWTKSMEQVAQQAEALS